MRKLCEQISSQWLENQKKKKSCNYDIEVDKWIQMEKVLITFNHLWFQNVAWSGAELNVNTMIFNFEKCAVKAQDFL